MQKIYKTKLNKMINYLNNIIKKYKNKSMQNQKLQKINILKLYIQMGIFFKDIKMKTILYKDGLNFSMLMAKNIMDNIKMECIMDQDVKIY